MGKDWFKPLKLFRFVRIWESSNQFTPFWNVGFNFCLVQEHALPENGSRGRALLCNLGGKVAKYWSAQIFLDVLQVPSPIEGPGCVTAEAISYWAEQVEPCTSEDQSSDNSWYGELIVSFACKRILLKQSILSIYNLILLPLQCLQILYTSFNSVKCNFVEWLLKMK